MSFVYIARLFFIYKDCQMRSIFQTPRRRRTGDGQKIEHIWQSFRPRRETSIAPRGRFCAETGRVFFATPISMINAVLLGGTQSPAVLHYDWKCLPDGRWYVENRAPKSVFVVFFRSRENDVDRRGFFAHIARLEAGLHRRYEQFSHAASHADESIFFGKQTRSLSSCTPNPLSHRRFHTIRRCLATPMFGFIHDSSD